MAKPRRLHVIEGERKEAENPHFTVVNHTVSEDAGQPSCWQAMVAQTILIPITVMVVIFLSAVTLSFAPVENQPPLVQIPPFIAIVTSFAYLVRAILWGTSIVVIDTAKIKDRIDAFSGPYVLGAGTLALLAAGAYWLTLPGPQGSPPAAKTQERVSVGAGPEKPAHELPKAAGGASSALPEKPRPRRKQSNR